MISIINRYFLNFFVWWYLVESKIFLAKLVGFWMFVLNVMNVIPMMQNLFRPLYQDYTFMGRLIAIPIRGIWVFVGVFTLILLLFPLAFLGISFILLPIMPFIGIFSLIFLT